MGRWEVPREFWRKTWGEGYHLEDQRQIRG
jgi:hypothetical protein